MNPLLSASTTLRGYGGRMLIVVQGIPNLEKIYGIAGAQGLMNACQLHAYMSINDPKTKAMLSRSLGNTEVERAARAFLKQARGTARLYQPLAIFTDKAPAYARVIGEINRHLGPNDAILHID